jgi:hypothetical protein
MASYISTFLLLRTLCTQDHFVAELPSYSHPSMPDKSDVMVQEDMHHADHGQAEDHIAIHTETYDIDVDALGTNLPKRYYWSPGFIGTVVVSSIPLQRLIF